MARKGTRKEALGILVDTHLLAGLHMFSLLSVASPHKTRARESLGVPVTVDGFFIVINKYVFVG